MDKAQEFAKKIVVPLTIDGKRDYELERTVERIVEKTYRAGYAAGIADANRREIEANDE